MSQEIKVYSSVVIWQNVEQNAYDQRPLISKLFVTDSDHDAAMRRKDKEIELLRRQRNELHNQYNEYVYLDDLTLYDAEITKAVGEIL
jgi:hypothetical protein